MKLFDYLSETRQELGKVTWPDRKKVTGLTIVIFVIVALVSSYVFLLDAVLSYLMKLFGRLFFIG